MMTNRDLTEEEIKKGWHYCPNWDWMLVNPDMVEFNYCACSEYVFWEKPQGPCDIQEIKE